MEIAQIAVLIALAWMIIALVSNKVPFGAIGLGIPFILIIGGVFESPIKAMGDLAGPTTLLVASIMILAQGIFKSGLAEVIGNFALKLTGGRNSTKLVLLVIIVISAALSMVPSQYRLRHDSIAGYHRNQHVHRHQPFPDAVRDEHGRWHWRLHDRNRHDH